MSSMNFSTSKQYVRPPERGIFPLDHDRECKDKMQVYLNCLKGAEDVHHKCRDFSRDYLQCRMDHQLMSKENLDHVSSFGVESFIDYVFLLSAVSICMSVFLFFLCSNIFLTALFLLLHCFLPCRYLFFIIPSITTAAMNVWLVRIWVR